ncbi:MAG: lysophospholipid acyltransferase family protein [Desulfurella sp.]
MKAFIFYIFLRFYRLFLRINVVEEYPIKSINSPIIYAFWHESILFLPFVYLGNNLSVLISTHKDGRLASDVIKYFKMGTIGGSVNRNPKKAFLEMLKLIKNQACDIGITPDGPRGPRRKAKLGVLELAYFSGYPIVPIAFEPKSAWRLNSWDRFAIPKPFSSVTFIYKKPIYVKTKEEIKSKVAELESKLNNEEY